MSGFAATGRYGRKVNPLMALIPNWATAVAGVKAQSQDATALFAGDSTWHGFGSVSNTVRERQSIIAKLADYLTAAGYPAVNAMVKPRDYTNAGWREDRIAIGGVPFNAASSGFVQFFGGLSMSIQNNSTTTEMTITPGIPWDIADIYYIRGGGGTIRAQATGGAPDNRVTSGGVSPVPFWGLSKHTVTAGSVDDNNVLTINRVSGNCFWSAFVFRRSDLKQVLLCNASYPGATLQQFDAESSGWERRASLRDFPADLTVFGNTINEAQAGNSVGTVLGFAQTHISRLKTTLGKDVAFVSPFPSSTPAFNTLERQYRDAIRGECQASGVPYFDMMGELYNDTWLASDMGDNLHSNDRGNRRGAAYKAPKFTP